MIRYCLLCLAFAAAFVSAPARAQTPPEEAMVIARDVVRLTGGEDAMRSMIEAMRPAMLADVMSRGVARDRAERYITIYLEEFDKEIPRVLELSAVAYAGAFSIAELEDIRAFYATSTGRALAERTPDLTAAMTQAGMVIAQEIAPRAVARLTNERPPDGPS